jgi:putative transposase
MARLARIVLPGVPYHVTQRGNRRQQTFFEEGDYALYRDLLAAAARRAGSRIWSYCLMPNHVHLIVVPEDEDGLRRNFADAHRRYTAFINARQRWTGHLWQGRYGAVAMDEPHLVAVARYVALNPVRAGLVERASDWPWSSVRAHLARDDDGLAEVAPLLERVGDFADFLGRAEDQQATRALRMAETTGARSGKRAGSARSRRKAADPLPPASAAPSRRPTSAEKFRVFSKLSP